MFVAMLGGYADIPTLAGVFSGWIVAIIAFYFMDEASERAGGQELSRKLNQQAQDNEEAAETALKEKQKIIQDLSDRVTTLANGIKEYEKLVAALELKLAGGKGKKSEK